MTTITKELIFKTEDKLHDMIKTRKIQLAEGFNPENALREAQLIIESNSKLLACSANSIQRAMLKIVVLGLSPMKQQVYFIPRGNQLCADISYLGSMALVKRFCGATEIVNMVIYEDDEFEYEIKGGKFQIPNHKSAFKNKIKDKLVGAYTVIFFPESFYVDIMTKDEIQRSWTKSAAYNENSVHNVFPEEMYKRTVCNRACKPWLRSSGDYIAIKHTQIKEGIETEIDHYANQIELDLGDYQPEQKAQPEHEAKGPLPEEPKNNQESEQIIDQDPLQEKKSHIAKQTIDFDRRIPDDPLVPSEPEPNYDEYYGRKEPVQRVANMPDF